MSPPIRDGSGDSIGSIRLGDGTEIAEVRTGAGDVVFGANAIPDSGLVHHYDATEITGSDGDAIGTWTDQEGTDDLTQSTSSAKPTLRTSEINGLQALEFDGSDDLMDVTFSSSISEPYEIFIVFRLRNTSNSYTIYDGDDSFDNLHETISGKWRIFQGSGVDGGTTDTNTHISDVIWRSGSSNDVLFLEGGSTTAIGDAGNANSSGLTVGARNDGSQNAAMDVGQVLLYNTELSTSNRNDVGNALERWGVTWTDV